MLTEIITEKVAEWWINRKIRKNLTIADYREINRLLIKAGRRCAYDLKHAAGALWMTQEKLRREGFESPRVDDHEFYADRADMWQGIFNAGDDGKNYRDRLHQRIWELEHMVKKYEKMLEDKGIHDPIAADKIPF